MSWCIYKCLFVNKKEIAQLFFFGLLSFRGGICMANKLLLFCLFRTAAVVLDAKLHV